jgi:hypothetical protein
MQVDRLAISKCIHSAFITHHSAFVFFALTLTLSPTYLLGIENRFRGEGNVVSELLPRVAAARQPWAIGSNRCAVKSLTLQDAKYL